MGRLGPVLLFLVFVRRASVVAMWAGASSAVSLVRNLHIGVKIWDMGVMTSALKGQTSCPIPDVHPKAFVCGQDVGVRPGESELDAFYFFGSTVRNEHVSRIGSGTKREARVPGNRLFVCFLRQMVMRNSDRTL